MKTLKTYTLLLLMISVEFLYSQEKEKDNAIYFNEKAAIEQAKAKGIKASDIKGYVQFLKSDFYSKESLKKESHKHTPYENNFPSQEREIIYSPNKTMSIGCPNASFEQYDFSNWTGQNGTFSGSAASPVYTMNNGIINTAGLNTPLGNTINYHTLLTIPPTNPNYPNCVGYDSLTVPVGGTVSEVPFISPYSLDGVSCRLLGAFGGAKVAKLKYIMSVTPSSKLFRYSYAVVLNDGHSSDPSSHQPYLKVSVRDQNGNPIVSCNDFNQDATTALNPTSGFKQSHLNYGGNNIIYKPWSVVSIDLSSPTYSLITSISIEFETAGCSATGHLGYAYVDAECGQGGISSAFCGGPNAVLMAPEGYTSYQWFDPSNNPIAAPSGTNSVLTVTAPVIGNVYSVSLSTPGGCTITLRDTLKATQVSISYINSAPSCSGGNSGAAMVTGAGSTGVYTYTWTSVATGSIVSNSQTATGLAPGNYSVVVASPGCGQQSANLSVGVAPPFFLAQSHPFCGSSTYIIKPNGSNYTWYQGTTMISPPLGGNDTLFVANATAGDQYTLVYSNPNGCRDSIKYTLAQIAGGNTYISSIANVCPGNANGSANINLNTPFSAPYSYTVTNASSTTILNTTTSNTLVSVSPLSIGVYTASIYDGVCFYNNTFTISTIQTNFTVTAPDTVLCFPTDTAMIYMNFGETTPTSCGLSTGSPCSSPNMVPVGTGTVQNSNTSMPCVFGNWYKNYRQQFLYTAAELLAAGVTPGKISSLAFDVISMNPKQVPTGNNSSIYSSVPFNYSIKMKCTNVNALTTTIDNTGLSQVFNGGYSANVGLNTINFNQAYDWDGTSNILIDICYDLQAWYTSNPVMRSTNKGVNRTVYVQSDTQPLCGFIGTGTTSQNSPNIYFGNCGSVNPASYTVSVSSNGTITANYANDSIKVVPTFSAPPVPNASTVYTITAINPDGGCIATRTISILYPSVTNSISVLPTSNNTICIGTQVTLSASGAVDYDWSYIQGGSPVNIANTATVNVTPPAVGVNTYVVTGSSPCPSSIPDTKTITVTVIPKADLIISPIQDMTKCMNRDFVITTGVNSTSPNPGTPYTYNWTTLPGNTPAPGNNTSSSYTCSSNNTSTLVLTVGGACANSTSDTVVIKNFDDDLTVSIVDSSSTCANTAFTLNSSVTGGYPAYNYAWYIDGVSAPISTSANLAYTSPDLQGNYVVAVYVNDSCGYNKGAYETIIVLPPCSIEIPNIITPNGDGVNDVFIIKNLEHHPNTVVTIFDRWGRKIYENSNYNNEWKAEGSSDGTYFYVIDVPDDKKYNGFITVFKGK